MRCVFLLAIVSVETLACVCVSPPSVKEAWEGATVVFSGSVEGVKPNPKSPFFHHLRQVARVRVEEPFKGCYKNQIFALLQPANDCDPQFKKGERVLLYLHRSPKPSFWEARGCGRVRLVEDGADDLLFLRALPASARRNRLAGEVSLYENWESHGRSRALRGIRVHFRSGSRSLEAVTNGDGIYELAGVPAARYRITIDVPKGLRIEVSAVGGGTGLRTHLQGAEPIVTIGDRTAADVDFILVADNRISGRVLGPAGAPVKDVCVHLEPATGKAKHLYMLDCSASDGRYTLKGMPSGRYVIGMAFRAEREPRKPGLYYPGTTRRKSAAVVAISGGQHLDGFDLRMTNLVR